MRPGQDARVDYEYVRNGVVNIFMANEPLKGKRIVEVTEFKTKKDWAAFIKWIADKEYPGAKRITLVMDNWDVVRYAEVLFLYSWLHYCLSVIINIHFSDR